MAKKYQQNLHVPTGFVPNLCTANSLLVFYIASVLLSLLVELIKKPLMQFDFVHFLLYTFVVTLVVFSTVATLCVARPVINRWKHNIAALFCLLIIMTNSLIFNTLAIKFFGMAEPGEEHFFALIRSLLITLIIGGVLLRFLYLQWYIVRQKRVKLEHKIEALQARIRPHFLFNSLNSISSLVMLDPDKAEDAISDLADVFRASLSRDHDSLISEELEVCKRYLRIEKLRLDKRLQERWDIEDEALDATMPHLLMQPLVENAIYHGIQLIPKGGVLDIAVKIIHDKVEVSVRNPMPTEVPEYKKHSNNMAMNNIRMRLQVLYGAKAELLTEKTDKTFTAIIRYPCSYT